MDESLHLPQTAVHFLLIVIFNMPTIRKSTTEVQVDDTIYLFERVQLADAFEACVAVADAEHCELEHRPASKRSAVPDATSAPAEGPA
ncbi:MAG TPA: hypothetical protein VEC01_08245 [Noviherbaspirillum sp.]|uniref:hypothetical protein n=1 Tax=Noviherbaspirillum sp. TaxID=1926288 RepID=UPI002D3C89FB|nr:hypothetical protein [Noviherbaspirillum sp.]HYD95301.1 hypothetical protein [Noviherbaspirillum sp.]